MSETDTKVTGDSPLDKVLERVRALVERAQHPDTTQHEAEACQAKADALMLAYSIKEIMAEGKKPQNQRVKPIFIRVEVTGWDNEIGGYFHNLVYRVASHCRCRIRISYDYDRHMFYAKVYGFEADVRYFEFLYTTLRLHMIGILLPKIEPGMSLEENCYRLHNAGFNWLEIAEKYGWAKQRPSDYPGVKIPYRHNASGEVQPSTMVGSRIKRAYHREVARRGETPTLITASGTHAFRMSAASGYFDMISQRLWKIETGRTAGVGVELHSVYQDLEEFFYQNEPDMRPKPVDPDDAPPPPTKRRGRQPKIKYIQHNADAYAFGTRHAATADLSPKVGGKSREALS